MITLHSILLMKLCYSMCMYGGKHAWYMYVCMYALKSIFMQADNHEYIGMYVCM